MQILSMRLLAVTIGLALTGAGFISKPHATAPLPASASNAHRQPTYYWYFVPDPFYIDYETIAYEEEEMEVDFGVTVNTDPTGGTLLDEGYINDSYPHNLPASEYLYGHF